MPQNIWLTKLLGKLKVILAFVFIFGLILAGLLFGYSQTLVKTIKIENIQTPLGVSGLDEVKGKNIFLISETQVSKRIKEKNPYIKNVTLKKEYPSTVSIVVSLYVEEAELNVGTGYFILASDGRVLSKNKKRVTSKPVINFYQKLNYYSYSAGDFVKINDITEAIYYINVLMDLGISVDSLDIKDRDMLLCNIGKKSVVFTTSRSREQQKYEITQIVREFRITGREYSTVDLRFEKPIIKF